MSNNFIDKNKRRLKKYSTELCNNCNGIGHMYKMCPYPITSYGIVMLSILSDNDVKEDIKNKLLTYENQYKLSEKEDSIRMITYNDIIPFCHYKNNIKFLMIQRKHTLGYMEFVRGRYNVENVSGIIFLFKQMTTREIKLIQKSTFEELWIDLWGDRRSKKFHVKEYEESKLNFEKLKETNENDDILGLQFYTNKVTPLWEYPEWGFPKGRKNRDESDRECAIREFFEESGYKENEYDMMESIEPIIEEFNGTNGVPYKHIYYTSLSKENREPILDPNNLHQMEEIGAIRWCTYEEAWELIRPHHEERKRFLTRLYMYILNNIIELYNNNGS